MTEVDRRLKDATEAGKSSPPNGDAAAAEVTACVNDDMIGLSGISIS